MSLNRRFYLFFQPKLAYVTKTVIKVSFDFFVSLWLYNPTHTLLYKLTRKENLCQMELCKANAV